MAGLPLYLAPSPVLGGFLAFIHTPVLGGFFCPFYPVLVLGGFFFPFSILLCYSIPTYYDKPPGTLAQKLYTNCGLPREIAKRYLSGEDFS